jgi:hypothetical protein
MIQFTHNLFKNGCQYIAANNPNYITAKRKDYNYFLVLNGGTTNGLIRNVVSVARTGISDAKFLSDFAEGNTVFIEGAGNQVVFQSGVSTPDSGFVTFLSSVDYQGVIINGFINATGSRSGVYIRYRMLAFKDVGFDTVIEKVVPFSNGEAKTNISSMLRFFLTLKATDENLSLVNIRDFNVSRKFNLVADEIYDNEVQATYNVLGNLFEGNFLYGVNNQKQAFEEFGSCLVEYFMQVNSNAKFLTKMKEPYRWDGYPFALYFIFSKELPPDNVGRKENNTLTPLSAYTPFNNIEYVNSLTLASNDYCVDVQLVTIENSAPITVDSYADNYADDYTESYTINVITQQDPISEVKRVCKGECADSPAYLRWRNSLGGFDYWLFGKRQVKSNRVDRFDTFEPVIFDIETEQESETVLTKDFNKAWTLGAYLKMQSVTDIQELFTSPFVQYWDEEKNKWYAVKINSGTYTEAITDETFSEVTFDIEFPKSYNQSQ